MKTPLQLRLENDPHLMRRLPLTASSRCSTPHFFCRAIYELAIIGLLLACVSCQSAPVAPMPVVPKVTTAPAVQRTVSAALLNTNCWYAKNRKGEQVICCPSAPLPPVTNISFVWDNMDCLGRTGAASCETFVVWSSTNLTAPKSLWPVKALVKGGAATFPTTNRQEFFTVNQP